MMCWIRWTYVGPRLAVIALLALAAQFGLPPLVRWSLVQSGQAVVGSKVDVGSVDLSLHRARVVLKDVAVADPTKPQRDLFRAGRVVLDVDPAALAHKRFVVQRGAIEGLEFGGDRDSSGEIDHEGGTFARLAQWVDSGAEQGQAWLGTYWRGLQTKLDEDLRREFQSVQLAESAAVRWPSLYQQYLTRASELLQRGRATEARIRRARENPLRNLAELRQATQELDRLNQDLGKLVDEIHALALQLERDREAVWTAWQADQQKLKESFAFDAIDASAVSGYLLQDEFAGRLGAVVWWIERVRALVPSGGGAPEPVRQRGVDVSFAGLRKHPGWLVRSLDLQGTGRMHGEPFELKGTIIGLSAEPALHGRPTVAKIVGRGAVTLDIEARFDRTGDVPVDRFVVHCPAIARSRAKLGRPDSFALAIGGGRDQIDADLTLREFELHGKIVVTMHADGLQITGNRASAPPRLMQALNDGLADIRRIETTLEVSGSIAKPELRLESTLGRQVLAAVQTAAGREAIARRKELEQLVEERIEVKLGEAERLTAEYRRQLEQRLTEQQTVLIRLAADTLGFGERPPIRLSSAEGEGGTSSPPPGSTFQR